MSIPNNIRLSELFKNECVEITNGDRVPQHAISEFYGMKCAGQAPPSLIVDGIFSLSSPRPGQLMVTFEDSQGLGVGNGEFEWGFNAYRINMANKIPVAENIKETSTALSFTLYGLSAGEYTIDKIIYRNGSKILEEPSFLFQTVDNYS